MKIWKVLAAVAGATAVASLIPYKVEKDEEAGVTTVKALAWTAVKTTDPEGGDTSLSVSILPGLGPKASAGDAGPDTGAQAGAEPAEAEMFDDSVNLADIIPSTTPEGD